VTKGLGERTGTAAGWLYYGGVVVLMSGLLLIGGYLQGTVQSEFKVIPWCSVTRQPRLARDQEKRVC
jgi:hypothetical protein